MKKHILLQINSLVNSGSTGRIAEEIGQRAIAAGYESYIACGRVARNSSSNVIHIGSPWNVRWHGFFSLFFDAHGFASKLATRKFVKQIEAINPDVILLHNIHGYYLNVEILVDFLKDKGVPVFWTLHDCWPFTGHCTYFDAVDCKRWQTHCYSCPNQKKYPKSLFIDRSKSNFEKKKKLFTSLSNVTFIPVCQWMGNVVKESYMNNRPQHVIYNGTNIDVFKPQSVDVVSDTRKKYGIKKGVVILGVASIWDKRKGLDDFIWLQGQLPENYQIVLVGLSEKQIKGLPCGITGIRRTENVQELAALYSLADVFVNPTYVDNFPTTNIESLACGTPVITYNTGGSPEAVDGNTGIIVPKGDRDSLKAAIVNVVANKDKYSSKTCRERAVDHFNKDDRFGDYIELFNQTLKIQ